MGVIIENQDVIDLLGEDAINNLTDDGEQTELITNAVEDAEAWVLGQLVFRYTAATLALSAQVQKTVKYYAAYLLTTRRGGIFYYGDVLDDLKEFIYDVRHRRVELSDSSGNQLTQDASDHLPITSHNLIVDERHPGDRIRTIDRSSHRTNNESSFRQDGTTFFGY